MRAAKAPRFDPWPPAFMLAALAASVVVVALLVVVVWLSFVQGLPGQPDLLYTLQNYREIFLDSYTYKVFLNTAVMAAIAMVISMTLGLILAWLVERTDMPGKPVVFTLMTVGLVVPGFAVALGWIFLLHPNIGIVNQLLMRVFDLPTAPLNIASLAGMGVIEGIALTPVVFIMTAVVLRSMDSSLEESGRMAGATLKRSLWSITLPLARPGIMAAGIYVAAIAVSAFDIPAVIGYSRGILTFSTYVYQQMNPADGLPPRFGAAAALGVFMIVVALGLSWWYATLLQDSPKYATVSGKGYRARAVELGRWKYAAVAFVAAFFAVAQVMPILMLLWTSGLPYVQFPSIAASEQLSLDNYSQLPADMILPAIKNTAILMIAVPTVALALSVAISWVVIRSQLPGRRFFDFVAFLPHSIPSIVFSVAAWLFALFVLRHIVPIYGTIWLLILVYVVVRLSYGTRMVNSALIQIHKELDESGRMSGASTGRVIRSILLPLLGPALIYSWIWIALLAFRELTLPVALASSDSRPLSVVVWSLIGSSSYGSAAAVAVIMLALMFPILFLYWTLTRRARAGSAI